MEGLRARGEAEKIAREIARIVEGLRKERELSYRKADESAGLSRNEFYRIEKLDGLPTAVTMLAIEQAFGLRPGTILRRAARAAEEKPAETASLETVSLDTMASEPRETGGEK